MRVNEKIKRAIFDRNKIDEHTHTHARMHACIYNTHIKNEKNAKQENKSHEMKLK